MRSKTVWIWTKGMAIKQKDVAVGFDGREVVIV